ncbi:Avirulence (Avh) protein, partial [Phytophthora megakarya]
DGLRANYNDGKLLNIFKAAMKYPSTKKLTTDLENALINKWFVEEKSVELLHNRLGHVDSYPDMIKRYEAKLKKVERNT